MSDTTIKKAKFVTNLFTKPLPVGTMVVTKEEKLVGGFVVKKGSVGQVLSRVEGSLLASVKVHFPSGQDVEYQRSQLLPQKESFQEKASLDCISQDTIQDCVVFKAQMGSRAYGMDTPASDYDIKGIFVLPTDLFLGIYQFKDEARYVLEHDNTKTESVYSELGKIFRLGLAGNADVIEIGVSPDIQFCHPVISPLIDRWSDLFVSKEVFASYRGYSIHQFELLQKDIENGEIRWKHAAHLLRLLHSGAHCMRTGEIMVRPEPEWSALLKEIRLGNVPYPEYDKMRLEAELVFESAFEQSKLPRFGKFEEANKVLTRIRNDVRDLGWKLRPYQGK